MCLFFACVSLGLSLGVSLAVSLDGQGEFVLRVTVRACLKSESNMALHAQHE